MKIRSRQNVKRSLKAKLMFATLSVVFILSLAFIFIDLTGHSESSQARPMEIKKQLSFSDPKAVEAKKSIDARPLISPDGKYLFFGRRNSEQNIGGKKDYQDIWFTTLDDNGNWEKITNLGETINNERGNGICSISPEGTEIVITNEYDKDVTTPISKSKLIKGKWSEPEPIEIVEYYNNNTFEDFFMAYHENKLFSASERTEGLGDQDIYISVENSKNKWSKPLNLGAVINSKEADFAPFLAADGKTLFFSSYREGGYGKSDIYMSKRLDDTWTNWSQPLNLGPDVNSADEENYFSVTSDMDKIFIESFSSLTNERKIFEVKLPMGNEAVAKASN